MGTFNTYGNKGRKWGGSNPVWLTVSQKQRSGGTLDPIPPVGTIIPAGTLVSIDEAGGKATIIKTFYIKNYDDTENVIYLRALRQDCVPQADMLLMEVPDSLIPSKRMEQVVTSTIKEVEHLAATNEYKVKIEGEFPTVKEGDMLMEGKYFENKGYFALAIPSGITENDVWIEDGDKYATVASVYHGEVMEDRIQPIPQCVKNILPQIKFVKGV